MFALGDLGRIGLFSFAFATPLSKSISTILMGIVGVVFLVVLLRRPKGLVCLLRDPVFWATISLTSVYLLGLLWTEDLAAGLKISRRISYILGAYVLCALFLRGAEDGLRMVKALVLGTVLLDILAVGKFLGFGSQRAFTLPSAVIMNPIWFGNVSAIALYGSLFLFLHHLEGEGKVSYLWGASALFNLMGVLLSNSRGPYGAAAVVLLFLLFPLFWRQRLGKAILALCLALLVLLPLHPRFQRKLWIVGREVKAFLSEGKPKGSVGRRLGMWKLSLEMFLDHPVIGVGTGDYELEVERRTAGEWVLLRKYNQPHSIYFHALAMQGLLGISTLLSFFVVVLRESLGQIREGGLERILGLFALAVSMHYLIAGLSETVLKIHVLVLMLGIVVGACFSWRTGFAKSSKDV